MRNRNLQGLICGIYNYIIRILLYGCCLQKNRLPFTGSLQFVVQVNRNVLN